MSHSGALHCPLEKLSFRNLSIESSHIIAQAVQNTKEFSHLYSKKTAQLAKGRGMHKWGGGALPVPSLPETDASSVLPPASWGQTLLSSKLCISKARSLLTLSEPSTIVLKEQLQAPMSLANALIYDSLLFCDREN